MDVLELYDSEIAIIQLLIDKLKKQYPSASCPNLLQKSSYFASELPRRIRAFYKDLKYCDDFKGVAIVRGFPIEKSVGPTPSSWDYKDSFSPNMNIDFFSVLLSSIMGDIFGWKTQQKGKVIHDLIPIDGSESAQTGYGSHSKLVLHTEDSFHEHRADYVALYCIRNPNNVNTTFSSIRDLDLCNDKKELLFQKRFFIKPDESHLDNNQTADNFSGQYMHDFCESDIEVEVLFGNFERPYICFDPYYTKDLRGIDNEAYLAFEKLSAQIEQNIFGTSLLPGDVAIFDNRKIVHGRESFQPNYDGTDRWMKRINITSNFRNSASSRQLSSYRLIGEPIAVS
jgi:Fe(II)/alpha-ketoglutarate-dependent arginine beta-hydroxylase